MKVLLSFLLIFFWGLLNAQQIKISSIDSGGASSTNGTLKAVYTIGEVAVQERTTATLHISEGFINSEILKPLDIDDYSVLTGIALYPNPTEDYLNIVFVNESKYTLSIYDFKGKLILERNLETLENKIELQKLSKGIYSVLIMDIQNELYKSYKLIKQ